MERSRPRETNPRGDGAANDIAWPAPWLYPFCMSIAAPSGDDTHVRFVGQRRSYWRLLVRGAVLLIATLGLYRFWLMTDVRRFLWSHSEVAGDTLEYSGSALELLLGFLVAVAILIPVYAAFFFAALDLGALGEWSGVIAFAALGFLGHYAIYRARRYRLTRTIYRGLRFVQTGSAWSYAVRAVGWWMLTVVTCGLAYPFQLASLERYKMRHTAYGTLPGRFAGSGWGLLIRGFPLWLMVVGPLLLALAGFASIDWSVLIRTLEVGGDDMMGRLEGGNPGFGRVVAFAMLMGGLGAAMAALLYPIFQAMVVRWWSSGLRFGGLQMRSRLRTRDVYAAYMRFLWYAVLFTVALAAAAVPLLFGLDLVDELLPGSAAAEIASVLVALCGYVVAALGYSTIYRGTVLFSMWQFGMQSLELTGIEVLEGVEAAGRPGSPLGEGLADALNVGGY